MRPQGTGGGPRYGEASTLASSERKLDDGQYRMEAAKDALAQFVTRLPDVPDLNVGLQVHGANLVAVEEGACLDSELVVPVAGFDRAELLQTIQAVDARGATPIAYSP